MELRFFMCKKCGNIIAYAKRSGREVSCCQAVMEEIIPNTKEASKEKHLPNVYLDDTMVSVQVGEVAHPMTNDHFIEWICIQTNQGNQRKMLVPDEEPRVTFRISASEKLEAVYAYCNLHGLWKVEL